MRVKMFRYGGNSLIRKRSPPQDHDRTLGMVLLYSAVVIGEGGILMSEVPFSLRATPEELWCELLELLEL